MKGVSMKLRHLSPLVFLALVGCKKEDPKPTVSSAAVSSVAAPPAVPKDGCAAGFTKVDPPGFCIKLPAGYTVGETKGKPPEEIQTEFLKDGEKWDGFTVRASSTETLDSLKDDYNRYLTNKDYNVVDKGDLPNGRYVLVDTKKYEGHTMGVYVKGAKFLFICESAGNTKAEKSKPTLEIAKTITPLGT